MHPSTILLALFATPLVAIASTTTTTMNPVVGGTGSVTNDNNNYDNNDKRTTTRYRRQAPRFESRRSSSSRKKKNKRTTSSSPFVSSDSKVALTRLSTRSERNRDVHSQVVLQQHIHRGVKRHARMTKRSVQVPDDVEFERRIVKRWHSVNSKVEQDDDNEKKEKKKDKRWFGGVALAGATETVQQIQNRLSRILAKDRNVTLPVGVGIGGGGGGAIGGARYGVSGYAGENIAKSRTTATTNNRTLGAPPQRGYDNTRDGYSIVDLEAASSNRVTNATEPTAINSLGLAIEANDVGYFATVYVGEEKTEFRVLMDSGSAGSFSRTSSFFLAPTVDFPFLSLCSCEKRFLDPFDILPR